jgi:hypothetical protein
LIIRDDGYRRTGAIRIGPRRTGSKNHDLCAGESAEAREVKINKRRIVLHYCTAFLSP